MSKTKEGELAQVIVFSTPTCGDCFRSRADLDAKHVMYHDVNIEPEAAQVDRDFVMKINEGYMSVPLILFFAAPVDSSQRAGFTETLTEPSGSQLRAALLRRGILRDSLKSIS